MKIGIFLTKYNSKDLQIAQYSLVRGYVKSDVLTDEGKLFVANMNKTGLLDSRTGKIVKPNDVKRFITLLPIVLKTGYIYAKKI